MSFRKVILIAVFSAMSTGAFAQAYIGGSIGSSHTKAPDPYFINPPDDLVVSFSKDFNQIGYKLFAGYNFNQYLALEGAYVDLGNANSTTTFNWAGNHYKAKSNFAHSSFNVAAKGTFPLHEQFNIFAKLGLSLNHRKISSEFQINNELEDQGEFSETRTSPLYGVGAEFLPVRNIGVRVEYENFGKFGKNDAGATKVDLWSLGVSYKF